MTTKKSDGQVLTGDEANLQAGQIITIEAGENVTAGKVGYIHLTNGKAYTSDTGTADDIRANGIFLTTATNGNDVDMLTFGVYTTTGLVDKADYYLGASGAISETRGAIRIGTALSTTELFIDIIQDDRDQIQTIKPWHEDMTGGITQLSAFWLACDGSAISDTESPFDGQNLPDLNSTQRFLRGSATTGTLSGADTHGHTMNGGSKGVPTPTADPGFGITSGGAVAAAPSANNIPKHMTVKFLMKIK